MDPPDFPLCQHGVIHQPVHELLMIAGRRVPVMTVLPTIPRRGADTGAVSEHSKGGKSLFTTMAEFDA
jgi:hypothetical protein